MIPSFSFQVAYMLKVTFVRPRRRSLQFSRRPAVDIVVSRHRQRKEAAIDIEQGGRIVGKEHLSLRNTATQHKDAAKFGEFDDHIGLDSPMETPAINYVGRARRGR